METNDTERSQLLRRIIELEEAARPLVEMLDKGRVQLYGAADAYREKANRLRRVLEQKG